MADLECECVNAPSENCPACGPAMRKESAEAHRKAVALQEEWAARIVAAERRRIRRAIAPALAKLRSAAESLRDGGYNMSLGHQDDAIAAIDAATRAPRARKAKVSGG